MKMKILLVSIILCLAFSGPALADPWCDNFGQDWNINFVSGSRNVIYVSGCRDCDGSLGCSGSLPLDGTVALDLFSSGIVFSVVAYDNPAAATCVSTHWNGKVVGNAILGDVSNENGPFGTFTLTPGACVAGASDAGDPSLE